MGEGVEYACKYKTITRSESLVFVICLFCISLGFFFECYRCCRKTELQELTEECLRLNIFHLAYEVNEIEIR